MKSLIKNFIINFLLKKDYNDWYVIISSREYNRYKTWEFIINSIEQYIIWNDYKFVSFFARRKKNKYRDI